MVFWEAFLEVHILCCPGFMLNLQGCQLFFFNLVPLIVLFQKLSLKVNHFSILVSNRNYHNFQCKPEFLMTERLMISNFLKASEMNSSITEEPFQVFFKVIHSLIQKTLSSQNINLFLFEHHLFHLLIFACWTWSLFTLKNIFIRKFSSKSKGFNHWKWFLREEKRGF